MLFVIDMQNDFIDQSKGKMKVYKADRIINGIIEKIDEYNSKEDIIFYTINIHENMDDDNRSKAEKKWGQSLYPPLDLKLKNHKKIEKTYYAISPDVAGEIKNRYENYDEYIKNIEIVGVETNICLISNAIVIQNMFPSSKIIINSKLCTSNDINMHKNALKLMESLNMEVI